MAADVHKFSERVIDMAQRLEDVADAVQGKGHRRGGGVSTRWLLLPVAGAGLYALATNNSFGRHAKGVIDQAKTRASELPEDLLGRVRQTSRTQSTAAGNQGTRQRSSARRSSSRRKTGRSASKSSSSR
jgi:hypothetical protein